MKKNILFLLAFSFCMAVFAQHPTTGQASYYGSKIHGRKTASGERYDRTKYTAAHKTLPFGTLLKVTNLSNGKSVVVRVNDRGPFVKGRIIDVSTIAAEELGFIKKGVAKVEIEIVKQEDLKIEEEKKDSTNQNQGNAPIKEIYQFNVIKTLPKGYSIQIGTFKEMINLMKLSENLESKYRSDVFVEVTDIKKEKLYKISVGKMKTKKEAEELKGQIKIQYPDCFIVKF